MSKILYSTEHLWFEINANTVKVGITDHLKSRISPSIIQISQIGTELKSGDSAGVLESNKSTYDLDSPIACKIIKHNDLLLQSPECISQQEEQNNWLYIAEIDANVDCKDLMDNDEYLSYIEP